MRSDSAVTTRTYYPHVEGLRGVAAFYVFLYHIWQYGISHAGATLTSLLPYTLPWMQFGHFAVSAFIVISGYCLGLPVAQRLEKPFDAARFAKRRARRLLPAYTLAALFLSVIPVLYASRPRTIRTASELFAAYRHRNLGTSGFNP